MKALDDEGIIVRAGDMAALPSLKRLGANTGARASCYVYTNTDTEEIDVLADSLNMIVTAQP